MAADLNEGLDGPLPQNSGQVAQKPRRTNRNFVFTKFIADDALGPQELPGHNCTYMAYSLERCPTTNRLHCQGFIHWREPTTLAVAHEAMPHTWIKPAHGSIRQNLRYITKLETHVSGPYEFGERPKQGERTDLDEVAGKIKDGLPLKRAAQEYPAQWVKFNRGLTSLRQMVVQPPKFRDLTVTWLWGPTACGKTRRVHESCDEDDLYTVHPNAKWWDGYDGQDTILFDEFYGHIDLEVMLRLLDHYRLQLEVKGGMTYAMWTKVWLTSNVDPMTLYAGARPETREAFFRRITTIEHMGV